MAGQFLTRSEIGDLSRELDKINSMRKRAQWEQHPTYAVVCGCPNRRCGGWYIIDTRRKILTDDEASDTLKRHNQNRKQSKAAGSFRGHCVIDLVTLQLIAESQ